MLHFYCIFLFVLNAVLNTDLQGSSSLELFGGRVGNYCGGRGKRCAWCCFTYRTPRRRKNLIRVYRQKFLRKHFTVWAEAIRSAADDCHKRTVSAPRGALVKWRHIPRLLYDCTEQSSHIMFPMTAYITAYPQPCIIADYRLCDLFKSFGFLLSPWREKLSKLIFGPCNVFFRSIESQFYAIVLKHECN